MEKALEIWIIFLKAAYLQCISTIKSFERGDSYD